MRELTRLNWFKPSPGLSYVIALLGVSAAVIANLLLETYLEAFPTLFLFLCAIIFAAWFGGVGPGVAATALSILAFDYFFLAPIHSVNLMLKNIPRICLVRDGRPFCRWTDGCAKKHSRVSSAVTC